ncbi:MAG: hypothetical protein R6V33_10270, partial [Pelovirga sp.]
PEITDIDPAVYDSNDLENTFIQFTVNIDDPSINEAIIVASYNGDLSRKEVTSISSFPATVELSLSDVAASLGIQLTDIALGDVFNIEVLTELNGQ